MKVLSGVDSECKWIDENMDMYDSRLHAKAVKQNIIKRYKILELQRKIVELEGDNNETL